MGFIQRPMLKPMIDFIESSPLVSGKIIPMAFDSSSAPESAALAYLGKTRPTLFKDVTNGKLLTKSASFGLLIRRFTNDPFIREDTADFLSQFEDWIEYEDVMRENSLYPMFSDTDYQRMVASNAMWWENASTNLDVYQIQINVEWQTEYIIKKNGW